MDSTDTNLKKSSNIEQMALIGKMHNMQWLKNNSQLSGHAKILQPSSDGKDTINPAPKIKINEGTKGRAEVISNNTVANRLELDKFDPALSKDTNESKSPVNKNTPQSAVEIVEFSPKNMETVWNKDVNVSSTVFQNSQPLSMQKLDDKEMISMSLAEDIVTVQLEQFRLNEDEKNKSNELRNEDDSEWDNVHRDVSDVPKSDSDVNNQVGSKQCHDNNNNNAKSKSQLPLETKKSIQRTTAKISTKKLGDPKIRKQGGTPLKESNIPLKHSSKFKDDPSNVCNDNNISSTSTDAKKVTVGATPKFVDKYDRAHGYNSNLIMGKGARMKEQPFLKQHFSTLKDSGNRNRSSMEGLDEKSKPVAAKLKLNRYESDKRANDIDDAKRCHKVQVTRTQSYNVQYNRNKPLIKSQQGYLRNSTKLDDDCSTNNSSGFNNSITMSTLTENASRKKCENQQPVINKNVSDSQYNPNTSGKIAKSSDVPDCSTSERDSMKSSLSNNCKRNYQNVPNNTKNTIDRNIKDEQVYAQRYKKDSNVYRHSSGVVHTYFKDINGKTKTEDQKRNVADTNLTKDYRVNRISSADPKVRSQPEGSRITVYPQKTSNGASNITKADALDAATVNNVQSAKSLNSCSSSTKDSINTNRSTRTSQESQVLHASRNETEVQYVKTGQEDTSINNSNNKTSNSEAKSVKFSDNVQEFNIAQSATSYTDNSVQQSRLPANSFYPDLQTANTSNAQQVENYHAVQNKSYIDNNNAQYNNTSTTNVQNTERGDLHMLDTVQQKPEQTSHMSPQNMLPQHNCDQTIPVGNGQPYQSMPTVYLNQYSNVQTVPRKTADSTVISQNPLIPSTSSYTVDTQNIVQSDASNILMHNTQTSILPPPGFHSHPITAQHNQWNLPIPEMFVFGNVINPSAHALNMPMQNSRHMCNAEFNNIQQPGYVQHPLYYVPPLCMQGWNPMLQYPAPIYQNPSYSNCNTFPNQVLAPSSMTDSMNCQVPTSMQSNPYKHYHQVQPLDNPPNFSVPVKLDNYMGNVQGCKSSNGRMKDNTVDVHMRASQYRAPVPNEYQSCSQQDAQLMIPYSYAVTMDSIARNAPSSMSMQMNQKYGPRAPLSTASYPRMAETCTVYHNNQESNSRKDDSLKNDSEFVPPIVSPREYMYYGVNYSRKTDTMQNSSARQDVKPVSYMHSVNSQHYVPQFQKNATYHAPQKDHSSRITTSRGMHRTMEQ